MYATRILCNTSLQAPPHHRILTYSILRTLLRLCKHNDNYPLLKSLLVNPNKTFNVVPWPPRLAKTADLYFIKSKYIVPTHQQYTLSQFVLKQYRKHINYSKLSEQLNNDVFYLIRYLHAQLDYAATKLDLQHVIQQLYKPTRKQYLQHIYNTVININPLLPIIQQSHITVPEYYNMKPVQNTQNIQPGMFLIAHPRLGEDPNTAVWAQSIVLITSYSTDGVHGVMINSPALHSTVGTHMDVRGDLDNVIHKTLKLSDSKYTDSSVNLVKTSELLYGGPVQGYKILHRIDSMNAWSNSILQSDSQHTQSVYIGQSDFIEQLSQRCDITKLNARDILVFVSHTQWTQKQLHDEINDGYWTLMSGNSNHIFLDYTNAHPVSIDKNAPVPTYTTDNNETDQTHNNTIESVHYNKLWPLAWYNHSDEGKYYAQCPFIRHTAIPNQALKEHKSIHTVELSETVTGHPNIRKSNNNNKNSDTDEQNDK